MAACSYEAFSDQPFRLKLLAGCFALYLLGTVLAIVLKGSASWFLIGLVVTSCFLVQTRVLSKKDSHARVSVLHTAMLCFWLITCCLVTFSFFLVLVLAGFNGDDFCDLLGSTSVTFLTATQIFYRARVDNAPAKTQQEATYVLVCLQVFGAVVGFFFMSIFLVDGFGRVISLAVYPPVDFVETPFGLVHYWCEGTVQNNTIMIFEAGFMAPGASLYWIQTGLAPYTRTCLYDRSGEGFSQVQEDVGFIAEARNMKAVVDQEFTRAGVPVGSRNVVVGGHSRGFQSAARFRVDYNASYNRVLVVGIDGSTCDRAAAADIVPAELLTYALSPFVSAASGVAWIFWPVIQGPALSFPVTSAVVFENCPLELQLGDIKNEGEFLQKLLRANIWRNSAERDYAWITRPALTAAQCQDFIFNSPEFLAVGASTVQVLGSDGITLCAAGHTAIVHRSDFAEIVTTRIKLFLDSRDLN